MKNTNVKRSNIKGKKDQEHNVRLELKLRLLLFWFRSMGVGTDFILFFLLQAWSLHIKPKPHVLIFISLQGFDILPNYQNFNFFTGSK
jgi:hypothetical protein